MTKRVGTLVITLGTVLAGSASAQDASCPMPVPPGELEEAPTGPEADLPTRDRYLGPSPAAHVGVVSGTAELDVGGFPILHVRARGDADLAEGIFRVDYADGSGFEGEVGCLYAEEDLAYVVGRIEAAHGTPVHAAGDWVVIGVHDGWRSVGKDAANFSPGLEARPTCTADGKAAPHVGLRRGDFSVQRVRPEPVT